MSNLTIVGISGHIASGKSTLAKAICDMDKHYRRAALADELKRDIAQLCGVTIEYIEQNKDLFRPILQYYGTEIMRQLYGEDYWVERLLSYVRKAEYNFIVVDDVRFPNELEGLRAAGTSLMVRLNISPDLQVQRCIEQYGHALEPAKLAHKSETALDNYFDFDITFDQGDKPLLPLYMASTILWHVENRRAIERLVPAQTR